MERGQENVDCGMENKDVNIGGQKKPSGHVICQEDDGEVD